MRVQSPELRTLSRMWRASLFSDPSQAFLEFDLNVLSSRDRIGIGFPERLPPGGEQPSGPVEFPGFERRGRRVFRDGLRWARAPHGEGQKQERGGDDDPPCDSSYLVGSSICETLDRAPWAATGRGGE
jgi:hypothetical protein